MYRTLASEDETPLQPIFSIDGVQENHVELFQGHKTSRRTILICSIILISTTSLLATWVFVAKPHFYPRLHLAHRSINNNKLTAVGNEFTNIRSWHHSRSKRSLEPLSKDSAVISPQLNHFDKRSGISKQPHKEKIYELVTDSNKYPYNNSRLPQNLIPMEYHLHFNIDLNDDNFTGEARIQLHCETPTDKIIFHGRRIIPKNITIFSGRSLINYYQVFYIKHFEMFVVELASKLESGSIYDLVVVYSVGYGNNLAGLYKSSYTDFGVKKYV